MATSSALLHQSEKAPDSSEPYVAMLRTSIERAEKLAADLVEQAGGPKEKTLLNPELAPFLKSKSRQDAAKQKQSILIVDDEQATLTLVERVLTEAGYVVATAQSGFECLDIFRQRPYSFHLILLDLTMPFIDGEETFQKLREIRANVPVVLCTGFIHQERLERLMAAGLTGFLRKPLPPDELLSAVRSMLQALRYSGPDVKTGGFPAVI